MRVGDYQLISQTLAQALNECRREPVSGVVLTIMQFADTLSADNPHFSKLRMIDDIQALTINVRAFDALHSLHNEYLEQEVVYSGEFDHE